ncbi:efflux transporter outer membrane subunit [Novilysobacter antarcticus]|uniref:efflux transporter outer membrane subunit n=1 Tax=Novilysobacter antarcticus TaxID=2862543 RepID=UPI001C99549C|nr:efflux transporter outer membrane subunit [Lysobacter antarcticus]
MSPVVCCLCRGFRPWFSVVALTFLLAACASTHGLKVTGTLLDDGDLRAVRTIDPERLSPAEFPAREWWKAFGDPQLDALVVEALEGAPSLDAADARARRASAVAGLVDAQRKPILGASAQVSGLQLPSTVAPDGLGGDFNTVGVLMMKLAYSPDLWGGKRAAWQAALGRSNAAQVEAQAARLTLAANVTKAYIALAQAYRMREAAGTEQARTQHLQQLASQRVAAGIDNQAQLHQIEGKISSARQELQAAQQQIDSLRTALAALLGKGPDRGLAITKPVLLDASVPALPSVLPSELLGHRPDIVAARWQVEAAAQDIKTSQAAFYPSVNLNALAGLASGSLSSLFSSDAVLLQGGPAISLPIFDGGRLRSQLAASNADYDLAVAQFNQRLVDALREVADALQSSRSLQARLASATAAHEAADAATEIAQLRYAAGIGTQMDILAAQAPLYELGQLLANLRAQRLGAMVDLHVGLGGGVDPVAPAHSPPDKDSAGPSAAAAEPAPSKAVIQ